MVFTATKGFTHISKEKHFGTIETRCDPYAQLAGTTQAQGRLLRFVMATRVQVGYAELQTGFCPMLDN